MKKFTPFFCLAWILYIVANFIMIERIGGPMKADAPDYPGFEVAFKTTYILAGLSLVICLFNLVYFLTAIVKFKSLFVTIAGSVSSLFSVYLLICIFMGLAAKSGFYFYKAGKACSIFGITQMVLASSFSFTPKKRESGSQ